MVRWSRAAIWAAVWVLVALLGCTPREPLVPRSVPEEPEPDEGLGQRLPQQLVDELVAEAERVRELELSEPIEAIAVSPEQIRAHIREQLAEMELALPEQIMRAFGFLPEELELEPLMVDLYGAEVIGLYDQEEDRLMVLRSVVSSLGSESMSAVEARAVLIHELVHALQDQNFDTLEQESDDAWADDADSVWSCLAEGDATLAMLVDTLQRAGAPVDVTIQPGFRDQARALSQAALPASAALSEAPPYFGYVMAATYFEGLTFAADLRRLGGWRAVDEAHRHPPRCTRDILHPERYLTGHRLWEIALPEALPGLAEPGYTPVHSATLGELETGAFLLPLEDDDRLRRAAEGWAGDRFVVLRSEERGLALAWRLRFETAADAGEFFDAALEVEVATGRGPCRGQVQQDEQHRAEPRFSVCAEGRDRIDVRGVDVALARNVPPEGVEPLIEALLAAEAVERAAEPPQPELVGRVSEL